MKSNISIYNLVTKQTRVVLQCDYHVEAPNWTPDGKALIVNSDGLLYSVSLDSPSMVLIETGFANKINNDHGVSPDGKLLVISDSSQTESSCIYTLPIEGGMPVKITTATPSYWHGWSPDGKTLAYTANRGDAYQIFSCSVEGGLETQLTHGFDHCDGPDYSADGKWIWFNGEKDGSVQLWRIPADGGSAEQMTQDNNVNWFPHPSPDGQHILFLAYEPGTKGHPAEKQVVLRLMAAEGGSATDLVPVFGGQGTINVPCWSPSSDEFAFVAYQM